MGSFGEATLIRACYIASPKLIISISPYPTLCVGLLATARLRRFFLTLTRPPPHIACLATALLRRWVTWREVFAYFADFAYFCVITRIFVYEDLSHTLESYYRRHRDYAC